MKTFRVYKHPTLGMDAVKVGFCWPSFFVGGVWLLYRRLWGWAALWFAAYFVVKFIDKAFEKLETMSSPENVEANILYVLVSILLSVGYIGIALVSGFKVNTFREKRLLNRGYEAVATLESKTGDAAIAQVAKGAQQPLPADVASQRG